MCLGADLPVREVVLYKHGVGYFERSGRLAAGEAARLDFDAAEMNDVLKSLTVDERGSGWISGLRYDSIDLLGHRLAEFGFQLGAAQSLSKTLDQLKGSRLELQFGSETVGGVILGARTLAGGDKQPEREQLTLMLDSGEFRTLDLSAATGLRFTDPKLQGQFKDYLAALAAARSKEKRSVYIDSTNAKEREVTARYMIPEPVWKSSYRLIFGTGAKPTLEGWAIVDNTSGEDWDKVKLSLVSGRPISFVSQLYPPRYVNRPNAELPDDQAAKPVIHQAAFDAEMRAAAPRLKAGPNTVASLNEAVGAGVGGAAFLQNDKDLAAQGVAAPSSIVAAAAGRDLGELFEYRISQPVSIRNNESAMLPFLQQPLDARKLLIYIQRGSEHPTNAVELTNSSGETLDGGPVTVYDGGAYAGEALMETLKAGDKRLISYAVDLGTRVTEAFGSKQAVVREIHASRGILTTKSAAEETRTYTARNVDQKSKTLIIEHPLRPGYELLNQKPMEKTATAYRFEVALAPGASAELPVSEERVYEQTASVTNLTPDMLLTYIRNRDLSAAARGQLQRIADQKAQLAEAGLAANDAEKQIRDLTSDEERIRRNIQSLNNISGQQQQVQNYARQLDAHEQQLAGLRDHQADLQRRQSALQTELNRQIDALSF